MKSFQHVQSPKNLRLWATLGILLGPWWLLAACTTTQTQLQSDKGLKKQPSLSPPPTRVASHPKKVAHSATKIAKPAVRSADPRWKGAPLAHAFLLNGGAQPQLNFYSHVLYLRMMLKTLQGQGLSQDAVTVFSSDGEDHSEDLLVLKARDVPGAQLFEHSPESRFFSEQPDLVNTQIKGTRLFSATRGVMSRRVGEVARQISSEDPRPVMVFVTDHGTRNRWSKDGRNNHISLWRDEMDVRTYHRMLQSFGQRRVISVMSQCFSGSFAWSAYADPSRLTPPAGDRCGFFATTPDRPAYGCFADTRLGESVGHAYRFIRAMQTSSTFEEAHRKVLLTDRTPDVPLRTSDSYLRAILEKEAARQRRSLPSLVDELLRQYGDKSYAGIQQDQAVISSIARRFDVSRPVTIAASKEMRKVLRKRHLWWRNVEDQWKSLFRTARNLHLRRWYKQNPGLRQLVQRELRRMASLQQATPTLAALVSTQKTSSVPAVVSSSAMAPWSSERIACIREPYRAPNVPGEAKVVERLRVGFAQYVKGVAGLESRLKTMLKKESEMHRYVFWLKIQSAALRRIEHQLYRVAGRLWLEHAKHSSAEAYREGLQRLMACEQSPLAPSAVAAKKKSLPTQKAMKSPPLPSWLGVQFRPLDGASLGLPPGAVLIRLVGMGSPAEKGGLRVGDTVIEVGGSALQEPYEIRERVMLAGAEQPVKMTILREGKSLVLSVQLQRMTTEPQLKTPPVLGRTIHSWMTVRTFRANPQAPYTRGPLPTLSKDTVMFFFWATWCGPCKRVLPLLRKWQTKYGPKGLKVVAVSAESLQTLEDWLKLQPQRMPFVHVSDPNGMFSSQFQIRATPTFVLLQQGKVALYQVGAYNTHTMEKKLQQAIASP
ncbi:MAG: redoxin domain-containing protein [Myxococcales bacterium]|nr:redoxin domain-containing protein [Myxococcales bacterium]